MCGTNFNKLLGHVLRSFEKKVPEGIESYASSTPSLSHSVIPPEFVACQRGELASSPGEAYYERLWRVMIPQRKALREASLDQQMRMVTHFLGAITLHNGYLWDP
jgi:hypothetical protein